MPNCDASARPDGVTGILAVQLPLPLGPYDYRVPEGLAPRPGDFVRVPLGARRVVGVAWGAGGGGVDAGKLRDVLAVLDTPPLPEDLRQLIAWTANYTLSPQGSVLRMAMSVPAALEPGKADTAYMLADGGGSARGRIRRTPARSRVLDVLADGRPRRLPEIRIAAGVGAGVVRGLADARLLRSVAIAPESRFETPDWRRTGHALSPAQAAAAAALRRRVGDGEASAFSVALLDGVTGSGKTEVYFEAVAAALAAGRQALVLLPEIALTSQWLERFEGRFGARPAAWHSELPAARRRDTWRAVAGGAVRVLVGARSALFLPFRELGLIVVDEEHDQSFKQEDGVVYNARDMAVVRGRTGRFPVVLASATPSLETVVNCRAGRYERLRLPERHGGAALPRVAAIDMRRESLDRQAWLSPTLRGELERTLAARHQALLFLNRRGYAPLTLCRACGHRLACSQCSAWLVEHRLAGRLECHHCGRAAAPLRVCPDCGAEDSFAACGPGVERLAEEAAGLFPAARIAVMASDTIHGPSAAAAFVARMQSREIDVLIGTQIVAKGHHFPYLTLVGVVDADLGLAGGDLRAAERTYQMLQQVAGRAGRASFPGSVWLQTYAPEHPVIRALIEGDRDGFVRAESAARERHAMPPFGRLAAVVLSGRDLAAVEAAGGALGRAAPRAEGVDVLGPAPAPLALLRGRHRRRLLLKARRDTAVQPILRRWLAGVRLPRGVRVQVDVDPYGFL